MLVRSCANRYLAYVQPLFSSPTRLSRGTSTSSKNTSLTSASPSISTIGRTVTPGDFMSISRNEMPVCGLPSVEVRTRQKIHSPYCPSVVHVFWPLTTYLSPSRTARVFTDARSEPDPGSL